MPSSKQIFTRLSRLSSILSQKNLFPLALFFVFISLVIILLRSLPSPTTLSQGKFPVSTKIYDRHGKLLYEIYADQNRTPVSLTSLPQHLIQATLAIEDKNFYHHHGFDIQGIIRAAFKTLTGQRLEGGSTITQQLVKVALLTPERTLKRKLKEALLTIATEIIYSKDQILEMYLNHIPYGGTAYGIESAAQLYFNKHASDLDLAEAALLAGLPQAPTLYSPFIHPDKAKKRQVQVLQSMVAAGFITSTQAKAAQNEQLHFAKPKTPIYAPHFVMYVKQLLEEKYGLRTVEQGGLRVTTSLDLDLQQAAESSLAAELTKIKHLHITNGAALITNPATGEILAMVGSKDYFAQDIDGKFNVTTSPRQPGSSIKPLNYALGIETKTITASTMLLDTPLCFLSPGQSPYCPQNYDLKFHGPVQIRSALANSYNIPAVKVLALNGLENFISFARRLGITTWTDPSRYGLSLTLGAGEVKMTDMAVAFGVFANYGTKVSLHPILKVTTYNNKTLQEYQPQQTLQQVQQQISLSPDQCLDNKCPLSKPLSPQTAFIISHILADNQARTPAFGSHSVLYFPNKQIAVKTGTTNNMRDNWTIGYTNRFLVAVWVGNNDNTPMSYVASGITGASPIWHALTQLALQKYGYSDWLQPPQDIDTHPVCLQSGVWPAADNPCPTRQEFFLPDTVPTHSRLVKREIWINNQTHLPPTKPEEFQDVSLQEHLLGSDPFVEDYCLDCFPPNPDPNQPPQPFYPRTFINYQPNSYTLHDR